MKDILIVDDELSILKTISLLFKKYGHNPHTASNSREAMDILKCKPVDIVFLDIRLAGESGIDLLKRIRDEYKDISIVMMSAYSSMDDTLKALELGAETYIAKPVRVEEAIFQINKISEKKELVLQNQRMKKICSYSSNNVTLVGISDKMKNLLQIVKRVSNLPSPVLIEGESGTGKEVIAKALHYYGSRAKKPFIGINCSAIPENLFESEFFGYNKGSFTGAVSDYQGLFQQANEGSFYLDDVDDIPLEFQPKLLRVLQEAIFRRIGGTKEYKMKCRIIASSKESLKERVKNNAFRKDLFYRLNIINVYVPPLRERREDIIPLAEYFMEKKQAYLGIKGKLLSQEAKSFLLGLDYYGNVRELENIIERLMVFSAGFEINREDIIKVLENDFNEHKGDLPGLKLKDMVRKKEAEIIRKVLAKYQGNRTYAAKELDISIRTLLYKIRDYDL